jgi:toxin ParE1/3/4
MEVGTATSPHINLRPAARRDLLEHFDYLRGEAGVETAVRFLIATEQAINLLAGRPRIGRICGFTGRISNRFRQWPLPGFENWLIFYLPLKNGVDILRILHGPRDLNALLE